MEHGPSQLYVAKVTWTLGHPFATCLTLEIPVNRAHSRIHQSTDFWFVRRLIHDLGVLDLGDRVTFLDCRMA
jgi:hypothetical protein